MHRISLRVFVTLLLLLVTQTAQAQFRYGHLSFRRTLEGLEFVVTEAWRTPNYSTVFTLDFGDGTSEMVLGNDLGVFDANTTNPYQLTRRTVLHNYPGAGPYTAVLRGCCHAPYLVNSPSSEVHIEAVVEPGLSVGEGTPTSAMFPTFWSPPGVTRSMRIPTQTSQGVSCHLATTAEAAGTIAAPVPGLTVSPDCVLTWNTSGLAEGQLYGAQVVLQNEGNRLQALRSAVDFMLYVASEAHAPTCAGFTASGPLQIGLQYHGTFTFTDDDPDDALTLATPLLQPGLQLFPGAGSTGFTGQRAPFRVDLVWTPNLDDRVPSAIYVGVTDSAGHTGLCALPFDLGSDAAPVVRLDPLPAVTGDATLHLRGVATDDHPPLTEVSTVVDGVSFAATVDVTGAVYADVPVAPDAPHAVSLRAVDAAGHVGASAPQTVYVDATSPRAALDALPALTRTASLTVSYLAADEHALASHRLLLNGAPVATTGPSGAVTVSLVEGVNTIVLEARDAADNVSSAIATVTLDTAAPTLRILGPNAGQVLGTATTPVSVAWGDASPTTVTMQGAAVASGSGASLAASGTWNFPGEGSQSVVVTAVDAAGNVATAAVDVFVDLAAPVLSATQSDGAPLRGVYGPQPGDLLPVTLRVDAARSAVTVTDDFGAPAQVIARDAGGATLTFGLPLREGANEFTLTATSEVGRAASLTIDLTYDETAPTGSFVTPTAAGFARGRTEVVVAARDALTGVGAVAVGLDDGAEVPAGAEGGEWSLALDTTALADGPHTLRARVTDVVGNAATTEVGFIVDNAPPVVSVVSSGEGDHVRGAITLSVAAADVTSGVRSVTVAVGGAPVGACATSPCAVSIDTRALLDGPFVVTATATDGAGNVTVTQRGLVADNLAPSHVLVSPTSGAVVRGSVTVTTHAADADFATVECSVDGVSLGVWSARDVTRVVSLAGTLDGAVAVRCVAKDTAGNTSVETATVTLRNWTFDVDPDTLRLRASECGQSPVTVRVRGAGVALLLPASRRALTLRVPAGAPVAPMGPLPTSLDRDGSLTLRFSRQGLVSSLRAGIAAGRIDPARPVPVHLASGERDLGGDAVRVIP